MLAEKLKVLVVDDMSTSRGLITMALNQLYISNFSTENSGEAAYQSLQQSPCHLIISDHNMPGWSGLDLLQHVRAHPQLGQTGFILITGSPTPEVIQQGMALGLNNYLAKPFTTADMQNCIEKIYGSLH